MDRTRERSAACVWLAAVVVACSPAAGEGGEGAGQELAEERAASNAAEWYIEAYDEMGDGLKRAAEAYDGPDDLTHALVESLETHAEQMATVMRAAWLDECRFPGAMDHGPQAKRPYMPVVRALGGALIADGDRLLLMGDADAAALRGAGAARLAVHAATQGRRTVDAEAAMALATGASVLIERAAAAGVQERTREELEVVFEALLDREDPMGVRAALSHEARGMARYIRHARLGESAPRLQGVLEELNQPAREVYARAYTGRIDAIVRAWNFEDAAKHIDDRIATDAEGGHILTEVLEPVVPLRRMFERYREAASSAREVVGGAGGADGAGSGSAS